MPRIGIIINNIGTPNSYSQKDVATYLKEFLMDKDIIGAPYFIRFLLVYGWIAPFRSPKSAKNYKKIWTDQGSPLMVHTQQLAKGIQERLGSEYQVEVGMRYGQPSIADAYKNLVNNKIEKIIFLPLYPQYAEATTGSANKKMKLIQNQFFQESRPNLNNLMIPQIHYLKEFYQEKFFLQSYHEFLTTELSKIPNWQECHFVFSYHGLPKKRLNQKYSDQCFETTKFICNKFNLSEKQSTTCFQSRLGPIEWLQPYTEPSIALLAKKGAQRIIILCPSFVADCIETLEEIGIGCKEVFELNGGKDFYLIPCLNSNTTWLDHLSNYLHEIDPID